MLIKTSFKTSFFFNKAFADAAVEPIDFPVAPAYAVPKVRTYPILPAFGLLIPRLQLLYFKCYSCPKA